MNKIAVGKIVKARLLSDKVFSTLMGASIGSGIGRLVGNAIDNKSPKNILATSFGGLGLGGGIGYLLSSMQEEKDEQILDKLNKRLSRLEKKVQK